MQGKEGKKDYFIYTYELSNIDKTIKVKFVYLLKGRNGKKGEVEKLEGKFLVPSCFMIPEKNNSKMIEIFEKWKIPYKTMRVMLK